MLLEADDALVSGEQFWARLESVEMVRIKALGSDRSSFRED